MSEQDTNREAAVVGSSDSAADALPERAVPHADGLATLVPIFIRAHVRRQELSMLSPPGLSPDYPVENAIEALGGRSLRGITRDFVSELGDRDLAIVRGRAFSPSPLTLAQLGERLSISRQRVSQVEQRLVDQANTVLTVNISAAAYAAAFQEVLPQALTWDELAKAVEPIAADDVEAAAGLIRLWLDYEWRGDWLVQPRAMQRWDDLKPAIRAAADDFHLVTHDRVALIVEGMFGADSSLERRLLELGFHRTPRGWLVDSSGRARLLHELHASDEPLTVEELADRAAISVGHAMNVVSTHPDVGRADKDRWALRDRIEDEYEGIVAEILQRVDAAGGSVSLTELVDEIPQRFGVAASSVRAYAQTPVFKIENGMVRRRDDYAFSPKPPDSIAGVLHLDVGWAQPVTIKREHLRGYSMVLSPHVAFANGLTPGQSLTAPIDGCQLFASVIWRLTSVNGTVEVGRCRAELIRRGFQESDRVFVVATPERVYLFTPRDLGEHRTSAPPQPMVEETDPGTHDPILDRLRRRHAPC